MKLKVMINSPQVQFPMQGEAGAGFPVTYLVLKAKLRDVLGSMFYRGRVLILTSDIDVGQR